MRPVQVAAGYLAFAGAAALMLLWSGFPYRPHTTAGWVAFFLLALPVVLAAETAAQWAWGNRLARKIGSETTGHTLSGRRLAYALVIMLIAFAAGRWATSLLSGGDGP